MTPSSNKVNGLRRTAPTSPERKARKKSVVSNLQSMLFFAYHRKQLLKTTRICMVEVDDAVSALSGELPFYICFRLQPILQPHAFRRAIHVVPRPEANNLADYAIRLGMFHE